MCLDNFGHLLYIPMTLLIFFQVNIVPITGNRERVVRMQGTSVVRVMWLAYPAVPCRRYRIPGNPFTDLACLEIVYKEVGLRLALQKYPSGPGQITHSVPTL